MGRLKIILLGLLLVALGACQRDLGVELPYEGDRLIIYGLISADSVITVKIARTAPPTGTFLYGQGVDNATAQLFEEGRLIDDLQHIGKGIYQSATGFKPVVGKAYFLRVAAPGFPTAETEPEVIPSAVAIDQYTLGDTLSSPFTGETARRLTFSFQDEEKDGNFYNVHITGEYMGNYVLLNTFVADRPLEASEDICGFRSEGNRYVLQDICFNGETFSFQLGVSTSGFLQEFKGLSDRPRGEVKCDRIVLRFMKITKTYRDYLYVAGREHEGFLSAFTTPIGEYTNVKGGYGLWAAYSENVVDVLQ